MRERNMDAHLPSVTPLMLEEPVIEGQQGKGRNMTLHANMIALTPSVASDASAIRADPVRQSCSHIKGLARLHHFASNNNLTLQGSLSQSLGVLISFGGSASTMAMTENHKVSPPS